MPVVIPLHGPATMRVLAFGCEPAEVRATTITAVARVDVVTHPALGCGIGRLMVARLGTDGLAARPFAGQRLESAIWLPSPPDILVSAATETRGMVPQAIRRELPWIMVLKAWRRLQPMAPPILMEVCWGHGEDRSMPVQASNRLEREVRFTAVALHRLLHYAPPDELVALSRDV